MIRGKMGFALVSIGIVVALMFAFAFDLAGADLAPVPAQNGACEEWIVNGGFEDGDTGWTQYSELGNPLIDTFYPHTLKKGAWLGSQNNAEDHLSQSVALPAGVQSLTLRYWWAIHTEEPPGGAFDIATIALLRADSSAITTTLAINNDSAEVLVWNEAIADLTSYAGQTVQLRFKAVTDIDNPTSFFFDDVSILACSDEGPSTPTPTVTLTVSPAATSRARLFLPLLLR